MKKVLLINMIALLAISCKQEPGTVTGVVTYFFNEYQGYKADVGAEVYLTSENCDSINNYLDASHAKQRIELNKLNLEELESYGENENSEMINDLNKLIKSDQEIVSSYTKDTAIFDQNEEKAFSKLHKIKTNNETYKTTVDGVGNFTIDVPPGKYNAIIISIGRTKENLLEVRGQIIIKSIEVKSKEKTNVDIKFEI